MFLNSITKEGYNFGRILFAHIYFKNLYLIVNHIIIFIDSLRIYYKNCSHSMNKWLFEFAVSLPSLSS